MTPTQDQLYKALKIAVEALEVTRQALLEIKTARENGPGWFTKGVSGQQSHIEMWLRKGFTAAQALDQILPIYKEMEK